MKRVCEICGADFEADAYRLEHGGARFCSRACQGKWHSAHMSGESNPAWRGGMTTRICEQCGSTFRAEENRVRRNGARFCSRACVSKWQSEHRIGKNGPRWTGGLLTRTCEECGAPFEAKRSLVARGCGRFCSSLCWGQWLSKHKAGQDSSQWRGGLSFEPYGHEFNRQLKQAVRQRDNLTCQLCGRAENGQAHIAHHINYIKTDNNPDNLITLCRECHSKTNFRRSYWQMVLGQMMERQSSLPQDQIREETQI